MTPSRRPSASSFPLGRRSLLLGGLGGVGAAAMGATVLAGARPAAASEQPPEFDFDLDTDNYFDSLVPQDENAGVSLNSEYFGPMDVTAFLWLNRIAAIAAFDAVAPYHETAVGIYSRVPRRPSSESATNRNMNIASLYAVWRAMQAVLGPKAPQTVPQLMASLGLDPDDHSESRTSPVGIGNRAGKAAYAHHKRDGMNILGDEGGRRYHPVPWADYTNYTPVNTAFELTDPTRWQPQLQPHNGRRVGGGPGDTGVFVAQHMITPHLGRVKALSFPDVTAFDFPAPDFISDSDSRSYRDAVDTVLAAQAGLTDEQKVLTEIMDNKLWGIGQSGVVILRNRDRNGEQGITGWAQFQTEHVLATFEASIAAWHHKVRYDTVRPISAVRHLYAGSEISAWGGPGLGTVDDMPGEEWMGYLPAGDHSEYPSGSTTLCAAASQVARRYFGDDDLEWTFTVKAGSTRTEPGIAPGRDIEVSFPTWTEFSRTCAASRVWAGAHFRETVDRSLGFGEQFGDLAHEYVQRFIRGEVRD